MDMNTATLPKKGLKTRPYRMDMEDHIVTLPKRGLKTRPYSIDMNEDMATLPKKGSKTRPYNIGIEKKGLTLFSMGYFKNTTVWGGALWPPLVTSLFLKVERQNLGAWGILMCLLQKWH